MLTRPDRRRALERGGVLSLLALAACAPAPGAAEICPRATAIVDGVTEAPPGLGPAALSVLAVQVLDGEGVVLESCTGVRLDEHRILTAAHCFESDQPAAVRLQDGPAIDPSFECPGHQSTDEGTEGVRVLSVHLHPARDVALLVTSPSDQPAVAICSLAPRAGDAAVAAGFGLDESGRLGGRRYLSVAVAAISDEAIDARAARAAGTCLGDSGGPLLIPSGETACLAGTLTTGSADCRGLERYVPSAMLADWLAAF
jgi:hypothetical protein